MERVWTLTRLALTLAETDFLDPALSGAPGDRERGVRLEVRPLVTAYAGSVYSSATTELGPAVCRVDLLESAPGAADRMHWHPRMSDGEPSERVFDPTMPADPGAWLTTRLRDLTGLLGGATPEQRDPLLADAPDVAALASEVGAVAVASLERLRRPWPEVVHDERGLAPVPLGAVGPTGD